MLAAGTDMAVSCTQMESRLYVPKHWKERWLPVGEGTGGGQGDVKIVRESGGTDGPLRFLKILRQQNDVERRGRMYLEVAACRTI